MAITMRPGNMPHIFWIDLKNDGVFVECAVMKRDEVGQVHYFEVRSLDRIDKGRLARILSNRNATHFELWDLMSNITLNNGVNALTYFHQLVHTLTPSGKIMRPQTGVVGLEGVSGSIDTKGIDARKMMEDSANVAATAAAKAAAEAATQAIFNMQNPAAATAPQAPPAAAEPTAPPPTAKRTTSRSTKKAAS